MRTRPTAVATVVATGLLLTGCGSSPLEGKTGPQVADAAADALEAAGSVHVSGTMTTDGQQGHIDLLLQGDDVLGTLTLGGADLQIIGSGGALYMQAPAEFWASSGLPPEARAMFEGRWVKVPAEGMEGMEEFSLPGFAGELRNPSDGAIRDEVATDGDVVVVSQEDGSTLRVADDDPAFPLELTNKGDSAGTVTFDRFGEKQDIAPPVNALDLSTLAGG